MESQEQIILEFDEPENVPPVLPEPPVFHAPQVKEKDSFLWLEVCMLLAVAQVYLAGYQYGVGNQGIQISFLQRLIDPSSFLGDPMVDTINSYPSYFFKILALVVPYTGIKTLYFSLHVFIAFALFCAVYLLSREIFKNRLAGIFAIALFVAGHHHALALSTLYSQGLTHTWFALPVCAFILLFYFKAKPVPAFLLAGLLFNIHALSSLYMCSILGLWILFQFKDFGIKKFLVSSFCFLFAASPTLYQVLTSHQIFDAEWLRLVNIRSPYHVFPSAWLQMGDSQKIPYFLLVAGTAMFAFRHPLKNAAGKKIALVIIAILTLFSIGYLGSEMFPEPIVIRAQLFRSSRILLLLFLILTAGGAAASWSSSKPRGSFWDWFERVLFFMIIAALAIPDAQTNQPLFISWLPLLLGIATVTTCLRGQLTILNSILLGSILFLLALSSKGINFQFIPNAFLGSLISSLTFLSIQFWMLILIIFIVGAASQLAKSLPIRLLLLPCVMVLAGLFAVIHADEFQRTPRADNWVDAQLWVKINTDENAKILTPPHYNGFRLHSKRPIVGEWRDGTQQFFNADYSKEWWRRMEALRPGIMYDTAGKKLLSEGKRLELMSDDQLTSLAEIFDAKYIVLPGNEKRDFIVAYENPGWTIFKNERPPQEPPPDGAKSAEIWKAQEKFLAETVYPNIEKYRKSDVTIQVVDENGLPFKNLNYELKQTNSNFGFGCALPFFIRPDKNPRKDDFYADEINEKQKKYFLELFNYSTIAWSAKWSSIEMKEGERNFDDLDMYVDFCHKNNIKLEYHFVSGYQPKWFKKKSADEKISIFKAHAEEVFERYHDKIQAWQIVNHKYMLNASVEVFKKIKEEHPELDLGISECARFYSKRLFNRKGEMASGLKEVKYLLDKEAPLDYFGFHGHRPFRLWADVRSMYEGIDYFTDEGVRVRLTELGTSSRGTIKGNVRSGEWTDELQAEYNVLMFTVAFSHPKVDAVNFWGIGPRTWIDNAGLLDENSEPKLTYYSLKKLIHETWRTNLKGMLGLDGALNYRGFNGTYDLKLLLPDGRQITGEFQTFRDQKNAFKFKMINGELVQLPSS